MFWLQQSSSVTKLFWTYEDLRGWNVLPNELQCCVNAHSSIYIRQFISHAIAMTLYHVTFYDLMLLCLMNWWNVTARSFVVAIFPCVAVFYANSLFSCFRCNPVVTSSNWQAVWRVRTWVAKVVPAPLFLVVRGGFHPLLTKGSAPQK